MLLRIFKRHAFRRAIARLNAAAQTLPIYGLGSISAWANLPIFPRHVPGEYWFPIRLGLRR